jgi:1,4-dihydroxy-2-naphthoate octaprenyltransferase
VYLFGDLARRSRLLFVFLAALTYMTGAGIARYLGSSIDAGVLVLGLLAILLVQGSMSLLASALARSRMEDLRPELGDRANSGRLASLYASVAAVATVCFLGYLIEATGGLSLQAGMNMVFALLVVFGFAVPPVRLVETEFGELLLSIQVAYLSPSVGFLLQARTYHPLLYVSAAALTSLFIAMLLVLGFRTYAQDTLVDRPTLLTRMGWENGMRLHHALLVLAFGILAFAVMSGFSLALIGPAFLALPFACLEVFMLRRIGSGARPIWSLLNATAIALFALVAYLLATGFWFR